MFAVYNEYTERIEAICPTKEDAVFIKLAMEARYYIAYAIFSLDEVAGEFENVMMEVEE